MQEKAILSLMRQHYIYVDVKRSPDGSYKDSAGANVAIDPAFWAAGQPIVARDCAYVGGEVLRLHTYHCDTPDTVHVTCV